ncbi:MAG: LysR family transcriptional regulator [Peptococcaceae bacterium]
MYIDSLKYLLTLQQTASTRKAAELLNTSYQNVSKVIKQLEEEFGVQLFQRTSQGMIPTEDAQTAFQFAQATLNHYERTLQYYQDKKMIAALSGQVTISTSPLINSIFLDKILDSFLQVYPAIQINFTPIDAYTPIEENPNCISVLPHTPNGPNQSANYELMIPLLQDKAIVVTKKNSTLGKQKSISQKKLHQLPLVIYNKNKLETSIYYYLLDKQLIDTSKPLITNIGSVFLTYVKSAGYTGLITYLMSKHDLFAKSDDLAFLDIRGFDSTITYYLYIRHLDKMTPQEQLFVQFIKNYFNICD